MKPSKKKSSARPARRRVHPPPEDRFEVLMEEMRGEFKAVAEGHASLERKIENEVAGLRGEMNQRFADTHRAMAAMGRDLSEKIDAVDAKQSARSDRLEARIDAVDAKLTARIDAVDAKLTARIDTVDTKLSKKIDDVARDLKDHRADTEAHAVVR